MASAAPEEPCHARRPRECGLKISVITACYNSAGTIGDTLASVARQANATIEHVVVDGGSTDGTLAMVEAFLPPVSNLVRGPDAGIYDALNKGVAHSRGDVVGFLHSDDVYAADDVLERVAREMEAHALDALYGDVAFVPANDLGRVVRVYSSRRFRPSLIGWGWMPAHPALFVRRRIFEQWGAFDATYRIAGDFEFVARVFSKPGLRFRYYPHVLVKMRLGGVSTRGLTNTITLNREVLKACRDNGIRTNYLKILSKYPAKMLEFVLR